jgi:hypothetical protein
MKKKSYCSTSNSMCNCICKMGVAFSRTASLDLFLLVASLQCQLPLPPSPLSRLPSLRPQWPLLNSEQGHRRGAPRLARRRASCARSGTELPRPHRRPQEERAQAARNGARAGRSRRRAATFASPHTVELLLAAVPTPARSGHATPCTASGIPEEAAIRRPHVEAEPLFFISGRATELRPRQRSASSSATSPPQPPRPHDKPGSDECGSGAGGGRCVDLRRD